MAKDKTVIGITGKPIPKPRTAKQQYELEKKRRMEKHLGKNVGGTQYRSDVNPYYNPRQRSFEEFMAICEARVPVTRQSGDFNYPRKTGEDFELDEIAQVPAGKKLRYKGGEPLPPSHKKSLETIQKMNRGIYPDPKPEPKPKSSEQQTPQRRNRFQFVDRSNASTQGNTRRGRGGSRFEEVELDEIMMVTPMKTGKTKRKSSGSLSKPHPSDPNYVELMRKWVKAKQMQREEIENFDEGIGMTMASALGNPPPVSRRMKLKRALIQREIEKNTKRNKTRRFSGKAADPNANTRRGPRARNSDDQNA